MSLAEKVANTPTKPKRPCRIKEIRDGLDDDERQALDHMLATWGAGKIGYALREEGHPHDSNALQRHLAGECSCYPPSLVEPS